MRIQPVHWFFSLVAVGLLASCYDLTLAPYTGDSGSGGAGTISGGGTGPAGHTGTGGAARADGAVGSDGVGGGVPDASGARPGGNSGGTRTTGGTTSAGGTTTPGGTIASGGTTSAGGTTTPGGTIASGGTTSAGGTATTGGTTASGGTGGRGGVGGGTTAPARTGGAGTAGTTAAASTDGKLCPGPTQALITDFTYAGGTDTTQVHFGDSSTLSGGEYVYPTGTDSYPLTSDVTQNNWHISVTVGTYSGFGLVFNNCSRIDAHAYKGISLKISGDAGPYGGVTFGVDTLDDSISATWLNSHGSTSATVPGRCTPPADPTLNQWSQSACANPTASIPVTATPVTQTVLWTDFSGGKPESDVNASDIIGIHWVFLWGGTPYPVDITIDDLSFVQ